MKSEPPHVVTVILNTNRRADTLACLASLRSNRYPNHQSLVLDNASSDGSVEAIRAAYPEVVIFDLVRNLGYAGNNNVGISGALELGADWIFILNEDTVLAADCLEQLIAVGEANPRIGIVGPLVYHYAEPSVIQSAGGRIGRNWQSCHIGQNTVDHGQFIQPQTVEWISGCAILVRRAFVQEVGLIDERFYYYWEETDWCMRAHQRNWLVVNVPQAKLWHKGVSRDYAPNPNVTYYNTRNRLLFMRKHHAPLLAWLVVWCQLGRTLASWTIRPKWSAMNGHRNAVWQGILDFARQRWGQRWIPTQ